MPFSVSLLRDHDKPDHENRNERDRAENDVDWFKEAGILFVRRIRRRNVLVMFVVVVHGSIRAQR